MLFLQLGPHKIGLANIFRHLKPEPLLKDRLDQIGVIPLAHIDLKSRGIPINLQGHKQVITEIDRKQELPELLQLDINRRLLPKGLVDTAEIDLLIDDTRAVLAVVETGEFVGFLLDGLVVGFAGA